MNKESEALMKNKKAAILLADNFEEVEATVPYDLLNRAGVKTDLISVQNQNTVKGNVGMHYTDLQMMKNTDFKDYDCLIIPGGDGYKILENDPQVIELIKEYGTDPEKVLGAICAGASIPGKLGLYKDRDYTCVPGLNGNYGGNYEKAHAVIAGNIVTGISVGGAYQFALDLIKVLISEEKAAEIAAATCWTL